MANTKRKPLAERFWEKVDRTGECWIWTGCRDSRGYGRFGVGRLAHPQVEAAHRMSYMLTYGPVPDGKEICHTCDIPACVRPEHLYAGTHAENQRDMSARKRAATGERHGVHLHPERVSRGEARPLAKLTETDVRAIRAEYAAGGISAKRLGWKYDVSEMAVLKIVWRKAWKHVV